MNWPLLFIVVWTTPLVVLGVWAVCRAACEDEPTTVDETADGSVWVLRGVPEHEHQAKVEAAVWN
jgi:hypothetical protein